MTVFLQSITLVGSIVSWISSGVQKYGITRLINSPQDVTVPAIQSRTDYEPFNTQISWQGETLATYIESKRTSDHHGLLLIDLEKNIAFLSLSTNV